MCLVTLSHLYIFVARHAVLGLGQVVFKRIGLVYIVSEVFLELLNLVLLTLHLQVVVLSLAL